MGTAALRAAQANLTRPGMRASWAHAAQASHARRMAQRRAAAPAPAIRGVANPMIKLTSAHLGGSVVNLICGNTPTSTVARPARLVVDALAV